MPHLYEHNARLFKSRKEMSLNVVFKTSNSMNNVIKCIFGTFGTSLPHSYTFKENNYYEMIF